MSLRRRRRSPESIDWSTPRPWRLRRWWRRASSRVPTLRERVVRLLVPRCGRSDNAAHVLAPIVLVGAIQTLAAGMVLAAFWGRRSAWLIPVGFLAGALISGLALLVLVCTLRALGRLFGALVWRRVKRRRPSRESRPTIQRPPAR